MIKDRAQLLPVNHFYIKISLFEYRQHIKLQWIVSQGSQLISLYSKFSSLLNWLLNQFFISYSFKQVEQFLMLLHKTIHLKRFIFSTAIIKCFVH